MKEQKTDKPLRIAKFGFRSIPPRPGSAGADTCSMELSVRLAERGHQITCYNRLYKDEKPEMSEYRGIKLVYHKTVHKAGFDTIIHSAKATFHIIFHNTADIVQIGNGGNSFWGIFLRLFGKKVIVTQDGVDWARDKWPWYGKLYLFLSTYLAVYVPHLLVFDNMFAQEDFEKKFGKKFKMIPSGVDVGEFKEDNEILKKLGLTPGGYILFVGRFIPDKGLHYLIPAFEQIKTDKKLVLIGGSPNPSAYENKMKQTTDPRIIFPGYIYGNDTLNLMKNAYLYVQPSDVEGLSPVILTIMALGTPLLCSNIRENLFIVKDDALVFKSGSTEDVKQQLSFALEHEQIIKDLAMKSKNRISQEYSWEKITDQYIDLYKS